MIGIARCMSPCGLTNINYNAKTHVRASQEETKQNPLSYCLTLYCSEFEFTLRDLGICGTQNFVQKMELCVDQRL